MKTYPILPEHINTTNPFWDAFGKAEKEDVANLIVRFCQKTNTWGPFLVGDSKEIKSWWIASYPNFFVKMDDGFYASHELISRSFAASPAVFVK
jgi:hypothetical protein